MAVHILTATDHFKGQLITGDFLAGTIGANPVEVRRVIALLRKAGLISVRRGEGGAALTRPLSEISFYDVYEATEMTGSKDLFRIHEHPCENCELGRNITAVLSKELSQVQAQFEDSLKKISVADTEKGIEELIRQEGA
jgi:DNA-binding IscR family transcriptional regulator